MTLDLPASLDAERLRRLALPLHRGPSGGATDVEPRIEVRVPFTGEVLTRLPETSVQQVESAARVARTAQIDWAARSIAARSEFLLRWHDAVLGAADDLCDMVQAESGKSRRDAFEEVADVANTLRYYGLVAERMLEPKRRRGALPLLTRTVELRHPHGLVGVISPWNYPLTLAAGDVIPALVAGNAVLHKPDSQTALTTLLVRELALSAGLPADMWQVVVGDGGMVGPTVIEQSDHVVFTGSTSTGRTVAAQAGGRLISADLELGGKNAMIVCADASLPRAVEGAVRGAFSSAGQLCLSIERIYVHQSVAATFTARLAAATRNVRLGAAFGHRYEMGSLVGPAQLAKVQAHVDDAVARGATVLAGGRRREDLGPYFFEPTVLTDVPSDALCFATETFGRGGAVYSRSHGHARAVAARLQAGTVNVNEPYAAAWGSVDAPMGGVKASGIGRRHGRDGLLAHTWAQTVATQRLWPIGEHGALRGAVYQRALTAGLRALKALRRP